MDNRLMKRYVSLEKRRRKLEDALDILIKKLTEIVPFVREQMSRAGLKQLKLDGLTISLRRQLWVKVLDRAAAVAALKASGMADYVAENFNSNSLSAFIREIEQTSGIHLGQCNYLMELEEQGIVLPPELQPLKMVVGLSEKIEPTTRKE